MAVLGDKKALTARKWCWKRVSRALKRPFCSSRMRERKYGKLRKKRTDCYSLPRGILGVWDNLSGGKTQFRFVLVIAEKSHFCHSATISLRCNCLISYFICNFAEYIDTGNKTNNDIIIVL
jgi:hypothetical protein